MESELLKKLDDMHNKNQHSLIVHTINSLPSEIQQEYEFAGRLGRAYNNLENFQRALEIFSKIAEPGADDAMWYYRRGYALFHLGKAQAAAEDFEHVLTLQPEHDEAAYYLGFIYGMVVPDKSKLRRAIALLKAQSSEKLEWLANDLARYRFEQLFIPLMEDISETVQFPTEQKQLLALGLIYHFMEEPDDSFLNYFCSKAYLLFNDAMDGLLITLSERNLAPTNPLTGEALPPEIIEKLYADLNICRMAIEASYLVVAHYTQDERLKKIEDIALYLTDEEFEQLASLAAEFRNHSYAFVLLIYARYNYE